MSSSHNSLRIGLLIDSFLVPNWIASIATDITVSDSLKIAVVVLNRGVGKRGRLLFSDYPRPSFFRLAHLYQYFDYSVFHPLLDALKEIDLTERLEGYPVIETEPVFDGPNFVFNEHDRTRLQEFDIDVLLLFCSGLAAGQVSPLARYGVWFFLDHKLLITGNLPVGFWEVLKQYPVTMQCLQALVAESPKPMILHRHYCPTDLRSIRRARNNLLWKSAAIVTRKLDQLHRSSSLAAVADIQQCSDDGFPNGAPSNLTMLKTISSHFSRFVHDRITDHSFYDQWVLAYKFTSCNEFLEDNFAGYNWLIPPKDRFWADPFPVQIEGSYFLFFEEFFNRENKGHVCVAAIDEEGLKEEPKTILKQEYHLSYPFIFPWKGDWYMIPESQEANRIDIYKFDSFPYKVSYLKTVMENVKAADATLLEADGRWWMFVAIASQGTWNVDELFLFYADSPLGPWAPHPKNPIKSDVRSARPAGQLFMQQGKYYRPAQDCSRGYGYAIRLQEIQVLSMTDYVEKEAGVILPNWSPKIMATHTLNSAGSLTFMDARQRRRR